MSLSKGCRLHAPRTEHPQPAAADTTTTPMMMMGSRRRAPTTTTDALRGKFDERDSLHGLNDRLAGFIEKVHQLERHNQLLEREIADIRGREKPASALELEYGAEIGRLRQLVRDISRQKHEIEMEHLNLEEEVSRLSGQRDKEARSRSDAERSVAALRKDIGEAYEAKLRLDGKAQSLLDEMLFLRSNHEAEVAEMLEQIRGAQQLAAEARGFGGAGVTAALRDIRAQLEGHAAADVQQVGETFRSQFARLTEEAESKREAVRASQQEIQEYRRRLQAKSVELDCAKGTRDALERQLHDVEDRHKEEMIHYQNTIKELENELINCKFDMSGYLREYQDLLNVKMALDVEILSYRKLLCGEEARLSSMSDGSISLPYIYHQSPVYTLPCLSRPGGPHRRAEPQYKFVEEIITETTREIEMSEFEETGSEETDVGRDEQGCKRDSGGSEEDGDQDHGEDQGEQVSDGQQGEGPAEVSRDEGGDGGSLDVVDDSEKDAKDKEESDEAADGEDIDTPKLIQSPDMEGNDQKIAENATEEKEDASRSPEPEGELPTQDKEEEEEKDTVDDVDKDPRSEPIQSPDVEKSDPKTVENGAEKKEDVTPSTKPKEEFCTKSKEESKETEAADNGEKDTQSKPMQSTDEIKVTENATEDKKDAVFPPKPKEELCTEIKEESKETKAADNGEKDTQGKPIQSPDVEKDEIKVTENATEDKKDAVLPPKPKEELCTEIKEESKETKTADNGEKDTQSKPMQSTDEIKVTENAREDKKDAVQPPKPKEELCTEIKEESKETKAADNGEKDTQGKPIQSPDVEKDEIKVTENATEDKKDAVLPPKSKKELCTEIKEESKETKAADNGEKDTQGKPIQSPDVEKDEIKVSKNATEDKKDAVPPSKPREEHGTEIKEESKEPKAADNGEKDTQSKPTPSTDVVKDDQKAVTVATEVKDDAALPPKPKEELPTKPKEESKRKEGDGNGDKDTRGKPAQSPDLGKDDQKTAENGTEEKEDAILAPKQKEELPTKPTEEAKVTEAADNGDKVTQSKHIQSPHKVAEDAKPKDEETPEANLPPKPKGEVPTKPLEESKEMEADDVDKEVQCKPTQSTDLEINDQKAAENATEAKGDAPLSPKQTEKPQEEKKEAAENGDKDNQSKPMATEAKQDAAVPPKAKEDLPTKPEGGEKDDAGGVEPHEPSARTTQPAEAQVQDKVQTSATAEKPADMRVGPKRETEDAHTKESKGQDPAEPLSDKPSKSVEEKADDSSKGGDKEPSPKPEVLKVKEAKEDAESKNQPGESMPPAIEKILSAGVAEVHKVAAESSPAPSPPQTEKSNDAPVKAEEKSGSKPEK